MNNLAISISILWHAVAKAVGTLANREKLPEGTFPVDLTIAGHVHGKKVYEQLRGNLVVNPDTERTKSVACDQKHLVGLLLANMTKAARRRIVDDLADQYRAAGNQLPAIEPEHLAEAELVLQQLRVSETVHCRGAVSWQAIAAAKAAA